ncbi:MAG: sugar phosphate isomerase/epimerase [Spirochaetaceae bacterium]|nr:MAG: sugar phosphate isomerase/epimerase [Spirochaetaceae bacterium]
MKIEQVAAQLYTLRDHLKTPDQMAKTLRQVRKIGYQAVQVSGTGPIDPHELRRILDGEGLTCCATHENSATILDSPKAVVEKLSILGCAHTAYPYPANIDFGSPRDVKNLIKQLDAAGRVLRDHGMVLSYHNHDIEFRQIKGRTVLEMIYAETDPNHLKAELDTHWVQAGGASVASWCRKMRGRMPLIHLKDYAIDNDRQRRFAEIGSGNLDWAEIISAAEESGCQWFIVEQDADWVDNDPFKSLKSSFKYIKDQLVS